MSKHYVARTVIEAIEIPDPPAATSRGYQADTPAPTRKKHTVANVVIADPDLQDLVNRVCQHLGLVTDGGAIE